jgi:2-polyprenyl-3-methyl-5-hydroxy-6-metoxy-1,4-benzoquinol methylase
VTGDVNRDRVSPQWTQWRSQVDLDEYETRFGRPDSHGEADFVESLCVGGGSATTVLDAGCGTGRLGIELHRRGIKVVGVDLDEDLLSRAQQKAPDVRWALADLADMELARDFDVVVMAGNVMQFCNVDQRAHVVHTCARHIKPGGALVAGFSLQLGDIAPLDLDTYDKMCESAGLTRVERWATWDRQPYAGGDYAVSVHRRPRT